MPAAGDGPAAPSKDWGLRSAQPMSTLDDLAIFLGGDPDGFTGDLLRLIRSADPASADRLRLAFPQETGVLGLWELIDPPPTFAQLQEVVDALHRLRGEAVRYGQQASRG